MGRESWKNEIIWRAIYEKFPLACGLSREPSTISVESKKQQLCQVQSEMQGR